MATDGERGTNHQALYRRYRPQTPAELIGQDHVVRALTGSIREGRLAHAFLFCGPRGTGKTSTARILAKMVNCVNAPTAEPCGVCEQCVAIRDGTHVDVVEIDAASHGGVDDARDLREKAPTAPMIGREKVYIIDEAQRLSREAFDALLKLFEEPPPGVRFVLATTEPHKMPATIVGRCQRFDFRRLTMEDLAAHLVTIAAAEDVKLDPAAAQAIARHAEGSARDALSLLDQATVLDGQEVDLVTVQTLLGTPRDEVQFELADVIAVGDVRGAFEVVDRLVQAGQDLRNVTGEALGHLRNLLLVKSAPGQEDLLDIPADGYDALRIQAEKFSGGELARVLSLLLAAQNDMRWTTSPRLSLELAHRACVPPGDRSDAGRSRRPARTPRTPGERDVRTARRRARGTGGPAARRPRPLAPGGAGRHSRSDPGGDRPSRAPEAAPEATTQMPVPHAADAGSVDVAMLRRSWGALIDHLGTLRQPILRAILESATVASFDGETLELAFPPDKKFAVQKVEGRQDELRQALSDLFGVSPRVVCVVRESRAPAEPASIAVVDEEDPPDDAEALRRVQEMLGATPMDEGG